MPNRGEALANSGSAFGVQDDAVVTALPNGGYVVVWVDGRRLDINDPNATGNQEYWGRLYNADGSANGGEFFIAGNDFINYYFSPFSVTALPVNAAAGLPNGGYLIVMNRGNLNDGTYDVVAQRYTVSGTPVGSLINVSTQPGIYEDSPSTAVFDDGSFVISWTDSGNGIGVVPPSEVFAQRFNANGTANGAKFQVNQTTEDAQYAVDIVALTSSYNVTNGRFVAVWADDQRDGNNNQFVDVHARIYNADGTSTNEFRINSTVPGDQSFPTIAALANGGFVVTWEEKIYSGNTVTNNDVYYRVFNASGVEVVAETRVNNTTTGRHYSNSVEALPDGGFVVLWTEWPGGVNDPSGSTTEVLGQRFNAAGIEVGSEFTVNTTTAGKQSFAEFSGPGNDAVTVLPYVAGQSTQQVVVAWHGNGPGDSTGVFTRQFEMHSAPSGTNNSKTILANQTYTFSASDFGFSDSAFDGAGDAFSSVVITTVPTGGKLYIDPDGAGTGSLGTEVTAGQAVTLAQLNAGRLVYVPAANGNDGSFTFQVKDNGGTSTGSQDTDQSANTFSFDNSLPNTAPDANDDAISATEAGGTNNGTAGTNPTGNLVTGTGAGGAVADIDDNDASSALTVVAVKTGPESNPGTTGTVGQALIGAHGTLTLNANGSYTYIVNQNDAQVQALLPGGTLTDTFNYTIQDSGGLQDTATVTFTINGANDAPATPVDTNAALNFVAEGAAVGTTLGITASATDPDGPSVTYSLTNDANGAFTIDVSTGVVTVADPSKIDFESSGGSYNLTVQASDGTLSSSQTFVVMVTNVAPSVPTDADAAANSVAEGAAAGTVVGITASSSDVNGPAVTYTLTNDANGAFAIDTNTGVVTVADPSMIDFESSGGSYNLTVQASDGTALPTQSFTVSVTDVNEAPTATGLSDSESYTEDTPLDLKNIVVSDVDAGAIITATLTLTNTAAGSLSTSGGATFVNGVWSITGTVAAVNAALADVTFNPAPDFNGSFSITTSVSDGIAAPVTDSKAFTGTPTDDPLQAANETVAVTQRLSASGNLIADAPVTDPDTAPAVTAIAFGGPSQPVGANTSIAGAHGTLIISTDGSYSYNADVEGGVAVGDSVTDTFTYTASAGSEQASASLSVTVTGSGQGDSNANTFLLTGSGHGAAGGGGDDTYTIDDGLDTVTEALSGGTDTVRSSIGHTLGANVENLVLLAGAGTAGGTGNRLANALTGNGSANVLDGEAGADILTGLAGDDGYIVDEAGDQVIEAAGGGVDRVYARVSYVLAAGQEVETLATISIANSKAIDLTGNEKAQTLYGNAGGNTLDGGGGADSLYGLSGNDRYVVDVAGDQVFEASGGGTDDRVLARDSYALAAGQDIEVLATISVAGTKVINLTGNEKGQSVSGNAGANLLDGKAGADVLQGYAGADTFAFSTALGAGNLDRIVDFSGVDDTIQLSRSVFSALNAGPLGAGAFKDLSAPGASVDTNDRILYDHNAGRLYYDADGSGAGQAVQFAILNNKAALTFQDFLVV